MCVYVFMCVMLTITNISHSTVREDVRRRKISSQTTATDNMQSHGSTKQVIGTRPYMSQEYLMLGQVCVSDTTIRMCCITSI